MSEKSPTALELERIWREQGVAWSHHRAGWGSTTHRKGEAEAGGFWKLVDYEHVVMKKGAVVPGYRKPEKRKT